jgi:excisionase family DNA binding protein
VTDGRLLTVDEAAEQLRTDPSTVRRLVRRGELEATKPCGRYLIPEGAVAELLERARVQPSPSEPPAPRPRRSAPALPPPPTGRAPGGSFRDRRRREAA